MVNKGIDLSEWSLTLSGYDCGFKLLAFHADEEGYYVRAELDKDRFMAAAGTKGSAVLRNGERWVRMEFDYVAPSLKTVVITSDSFSLKQRRFFGIMEDRDPPRPDLVDPEIVFFISSDGESYAYHSMRMVYSDVLEQRAPGGSIAYNKKGAWYSEVDKSYGEERLYTYGKRAESNDVSQIKVIRVDTKGTDAGSGEDEPDGATP